jgi:hypothetical protein
MHEEMIEGIKCQNCGKEIPEEEVLATEGGRRSS